MARSAHIEVAKTGRYFIEGHLGKDTREVWIVCHGYGYLAEFFIKYFKCLVSDSCCVIAPEGLNKFYKEGMGGEVGASWMTSSDRLSEIDDYVNYLDRLLEVTLAEVDRNAVTLNVLGFSQGTATVCRWLTKGMVKPDNFVLWAGEIPDDVDIQKFNKELGEEPVHLVIGDNDEFISEAMVEDYGSYLRSKEINFDLHRYNGGHKINEAVLLEIAGRFQQS
jgi:predicted esterase